MKSIIILFAILSSFTGSAFAQEITGKLEGRTIDAHGAPLPGVTILLQSESLQGVRGSSTTTEGTFSIEALPIGIYRVKISCVGYQPISFENLRINLGKTTMLGDIRLRQGQITMPELVIVAPRATIDPASTVYGGSLNAAEFTNLPLERNYQEMISLLPQANLSYFGDGANIGGATGYENKYFVDGVEVTDPSYGNTGTYLPYNFMKEVEVKAGGYGADDHSSLGGNVNVVTNSGTNDFHGSLFGFYSGNRFNGHQKLGTDDPTQGDFSDYDIGFSLGGPVVRDELWFFAAYNPTFANRDVSIPGFGTSVDRTVRHSFAAKFNWNALPTTNFIVTITGDPGTHQNVGKNILYPPVSITNPDMYLMNSREGGVNIALAGNMALRPDLLLEGSIARVTKHETDDPATAGGKDMYVEDDVNRIFSGGVGYNWGSYRANTLAKLAVRLTAGDHSLTAGTEYKATEDENSYNEHKLFRVSDTTYVEQIGWGDQRIRQRLPSAFIQDSWKISQRLRVLAGLRWDGQYIIGSDGKVDQTIIVPIQPRAGFTLLPEENGRSKLYGSYGRFSHEFSILPSTQIYSDQGYEHYFTYNHDPRIDRSGASPAFNAMIIFPDQAGLHGQYDDEFSLGYERVIGSDLKVGIQGVYKTLRKVLDDGYVLSEGRFRTGNFGEGLLSDFPKPQRIYEALVITIERFGHENFNFMVSYVLSRDYGNYAGLYDAVSHGSWPNYNSQMDNPFFSWINTTGLLPNDRTHIFKFSGSYHFPIGLDLGLSFVAQSGTPLSDLAYTNVGIKFLSPRGTAGRTPPLWDLGARVAYEVPSGNVRLIMDVFHIASQLTAVDINQFHYFALDDNGNPIDPNPDYGKPYRYQHPISVRIGMEKQF